MRQDHPLRAIRRLTDEVLAASSPRFTKMYSEIGRPSIPPEQLLRALLIQSLYTVRSERFLMEEIDYSMLYRWFVGLSMDAPIWSPTTPSARIGTTWWKVTSLPRSLTASSRGCSLGRTLHSRWNAAGSVGQSQELLPQGRRADAALCATAATGTAEREAALLLLGALPHGDTVDGDKGFDVPSFVAGVRALTITPHIERQCD